jgi:hypothetical protein
MGLRFPIFRDLLLLLLCRREVLQQLVHGSLANMAMHSSTPGR